MLRSLLYCLKDKLQVYLVSTGARLAEDTLSERAGAKRARSTRTLSAASGQECSEADETEKCAAASTSNQRRKERKREGHRQGFVACTRV